MRSVQNLKIYTFFDNLRINSGRYMETTQMIPFFHLVFLPYLSVTFISLNLKILKKCRQKSLIWTAHHSFLESRHPDFPKNLYYVLSTC